MNAKVSKIAATVAVGLACIAMPVLAAPVALTFNNNIASFGNTFGSATSFNDFFSFTVKTPSANAYGTASSNVVFNADPSPSFPVTFATFNIFSIPAGTGTPLGTAILNLYPGNVFVNATGLGAGNYYLEVAGSVGPHGGAYTGSLTLAAVPEPGEWVLMLSGLGMLGFMVRRRTRKIG